jgi:hypothetical protein
MMRPALQATLAIVAWVGSTLAATVSPRAQMDGSERQAQCELSTIRDTRSPLAIQLIHAACNWLAIDSGPLNENNQRYHRCLLQYLSGVQDDAAASRVVSACRTSYPP